jgi:nucleoid DNA-binding protein
MKVAAMGEFFEQLSDRIKNQVKEITKSSNLPYTDDSIEKIAQTWVEKKNMFSEQIKLLHMVEVERLPGNDKKGALLLTYSGSLISLGTLEAATGSGGTGLADTGSGDTGLADTRSGGTRSVEYASIELRNDVPDIAKKEAASLSCDAELNTPLEFEDGPIKKSSPLYKIAVCPEGVSLPEQEERIRQATIFLTNGFVRINRTIISPGEDHPDQFTMKSMIAYVALKNGTTQKMAKQIVEDFMITVETGVLLGAKVPLGKMGRLFLKKRAALKARVGRNPATGEEITIKSKPEILVPKFSFGKQLKEKALYINT